MDLQLWLPSEGGGTAQQYIKTMARIKQIEKGIIKAMNTRSCEALSASPTTNKDIEEHDTLHHQYYAWLRKARQNNIEHKN